MDLLRSLTPYPLCIKYLCDALLGGVEVYWITDLHPSGIAFTPTELEKRDALTGQGEVYPHFALSGSEPFR